MPHEALGEPRAVQLANAAASFCQRVHCHRIEPTMPTARTSSLLRLYALTAALEVALYFGLFLGAGGRGPAANLLRGRQAQAIVVTATSPAPPLPKREPRAVWLPQPEEPNFSQVYVLFFMLLILLRAVLATVHSVRAGRRKA